MGERGVAVVVALITARNSWSDGAVMGEIGVAVVVALITVRRS
jgi:hypothetical protein